MISGKDRRQTLLLPECPDDYDAQDNPVRVIPTHGSSDPWFHFRDQRQACVVACPPLKSELPWAGIIDAFINELDLLALGFTRAQPAATGRPAYHPAILLKIYLYGYLHRVPSSRRLEHEAGRNLELIYLAGQLAPDFMTLELREYRMGVAQPETAL